MLAPSRILMSGAALAYYMPEQVRRSSRTRRCVEECPPDYDFVICDQGLASPTCGACRLPGDMPGRRVERRALTVRGGSFMPGGGTPLPTERRPSVRMDSYGHDARRAPSRAFLLVRSVREAPRVGLEQPEDRQSRPLAPREARQGAPQTRDRPHPRGAGGSPGLPHRHRSGIRY